MPPTCFLVNGLGGQEVLNQRISDGQRVGGERRKPPLFAVFVRSTAGVGRTTDALRYMYAASPLQPPPILTRAYLFTASPSLQLRGHGISSENLVSIDRGRECR